MSNSIPLSEKEAKYLHTNDIPYKKITAKYGEIRNGSRFFKANSDLYYLAHNNTDNSSIIYNVSIEKVSPELSMYIDGAVVNKANATTIIHIPILHGQKSYNLNISLKSSLLIGNEANYTYSIKLGNGAILSSESLNSSNIEKILNYKIPANENATITFETLGNENYTAVDPTGVTVPTSILYYIPITISHSYSDVTYSTNAVLTGDLYCNDVTIDTGVTLITNGFSFICTGTFTNDGTIDTGIASNGVVADNGIGGGASTGTSGFGDSISYGGSGAGGGGGASYVGGTGGPTLVGGGSGGGKSTAGTAGSNQIISSLTDNEIFDMYENGFLNELMGAGGAGGGGYHHGSTTNYGGNGGVGALGIYIQANVINAGVINANGIGGVAGSGSGTTG